MNLNSLVKQITDIVAPLLSLALILLIVGTMLAQLGFPIRAVRALSPTELAYLAGAVWLWRKAAP